tara:strand:+ start:919 stop:1155 length:237 start_codon:yes stop_codon:yes gene_type:complete
MGLIKETNNDISIVGEFKHVEIKNITIIKEDDIEISRSISRHVIDSSMDITSQPQEVKDICALIWTPAIKAKLIDSRA